MKRLNEDGVDTVFVTVVQTITETQVIDYTLAASFARSLAGRHQNTHPVNHAVRGKGPAPSQTTRTAQQFEQVAAAGESNDDSIQRQKPSLLVQNSDWAIKRFPFHSTKTAIIFRKHVTVADRSVMASCGWASQKCATVRWCWPMIRCAVGRCRTRPCGMGSVGTDHGVKSRITLTCSNCTVTATNGAG
jgi:hypothetical protein